MTLRKSHCKLKGKRPRPGHSLVEAPGSIPSIIHTRKVYWLQVHDQGNPLRNIKGSVSINACSQKAWWCIWWRLQLVHTVMKVYVVMNMVEATVSIDCQVDSMHIALWTSFHTYLEGVCRLVNTGHAYEGLSPLGWLWWKDLPRKWAAPFPRQDTIWKPGLGSQTTKGGGRRLSTSVPCSFPRLWTQCHQLLQTFAASTRQA